MSMSLAGTFGRTFSPFFFPRRLGTNVPFPQTHSAELPGGHDERWEEGGEGIFSEAADVVTRVSF